MLVRALMFIVLTPLMFLVKYGSKNKVDNIKLISINKIKMCVEWNFYQKIFREAIIAQ